MPSQPWRLDLFVSSPSDLYPQHKVITEVANNLNADMDHQGIQFRTLSVTSMPPGAATNPQLLIADRVKSCDIYLGLMSAKFGSPADGYGSGTESEFHAALNRFDADPSALRLLFYFLPPSNLFSVDPDQLRSVQLFRKRISDSILWVEVDDLQGFPARLRRDLRTLIDTEWENGKWRVAGSMNQPKGSAASSDHPLFVDLSAFGNEAAEIGNHGNGNLVVVEEDRLEEDLGLLDIMEMSEESLGRATRYLEEVGQITKELGEFVSGAAAELDDKQTNSERKAVVNSVAKKMISVAARTKRIAGDLISEYDAALNAIMEGYQLGAQDGLSDKDREVIQELCSALLQNEETMRTVSEQVESYRDTIAAIPRATSMMNKARVLSVDALGDMMASLVLVADKSREIRRQLEEP